MSRRKPISIWDMKDLFKCVNKENCSMCDKRKLLALMECFVKTVKNPRDIKSTEKMIRKLKVQLKSAPKKRRHRRKAKFGVEDTDTLKSSSSSTVSDSSTESTPEDTDTSTMSDTDTTSFGQSTGLMVSNRFGEYTRGYGATY